MALEVKNNFTRLQEDNSYLYLWLVSLSIQHRDPGAMVAVNKNNGKLQAIITPSRGEFKQDIIENILSMHKILGIRVDFSKSSALQKIITYNFEI